MAGRRGRSREQLLADRASIARQALENKPQHEIAKSIGLSPSQICRELARIRKEWREATMEDAGILVGEQIAKLNHIERQCWQAWEKSKLPYEASTLKKIEPGTDRRGRRVSERTITMLQRANRDGDPRFLDVVRECVMARCRILGLVAPLRVLHGGDKDSPPIQHQHGHIDLRQATPEEMETLRRIHSKLCERQAQANGSPGAEPIALPPRPPDS